LVLSGDSGEHSRHLSPLDLSLGRLSDGEEQAAIVGMSGLGRAVFEKRTVTGRVRESSGRVQGGDDASEESGDARRSVVDGLSQIPYRRIGCQINLERSRTFEDDRQPTALIAKLSGSGRTGIVRFKDFMPRRNESTNAIGAPGYYTFGE
jgi:hypothetical protein